MIEGRDKVGAVAMGLLDSVEREYGEDNDAEVIQLIVAAEVAYTDEDGDRATHIAYEYTATRPVERGGLWYYLGRALGVTP